MENWTRTIHTDVTSPWMSPESPRLGEEVTIRVRVARDAPVDALYLRTIKDGIDHHVPASLARTGTRFVWYHAVFTLEQPATNFHVLVRTASGGTVYWNRMGASSVFPNEDHDLTIDTRFHVPDWVRSSVFYQIFPDRYHRGDEHLGVADGEIRRGEFVSRSMSWDEAPLPYPQGGSLDFFNGDLPGIEAKLDYLADLGITAVYLTPIFTAKTNHRYDCLDYFSVDRHLGGDEALASLVRAAHGRGMKVMLDVSINHIGVEHAWAEGMEVDGRSVRVVAKDEAGRPVNWLGVPDLLKLDYTVPELRDVIYRGADSVVQRYLRPPFAIDGWRFDVASETGRYREHQDGHQLWREIRTVIKSINPDAYVIGEHWHDSFAYLRGDQWDSAMNYFASGRLIRMWLGEQDRFATVPSSEALPGRRISGIELAGLIDQHFARIPNGAVHAQFNLLDSHDVTRLHTNPSVFRWESYEGAVALAFMLPGTFSVYYGDEVGIDGSLDGDHGKRHPMPWHREQWDAGFMDLYRSLIAIKRSSDVLHRGSYRVLDAGDDHLVFARFNDRQALVLILNRLQTARTYTIDAGLLGIATAAVVPFGPNGMDRGEPQYAGEPGGSAAGAAQSPAGAAQSLPDARDAVHTRADVAVSDGHLIVTAPAGRSVLLRCVLSD